MNGHKTKIADIENELNAYPIKGFKFKVDQLAVSNDLAYIRPQIRLDIYAQYDHTNPAEPIDVLNWFFLALNDYVKDIPGNSLELHYEHDDSGRIQTRAEVVIKVY